MIELSFEIFPPKTDTGLTNLGTALAAMSGAASPRYISVTYGAGGSSRDRSYTAIEAAFRHGHGTPVAAHLTCVGQSRSDIEDIIEHYSSLGVKHIVALRGDPPEGIDAPYQPHPDGFQSTADLVAAIKSHGDFYVSVSAYPEVHPQSNGIDHDLDVLAAKVDAGADAAMTQMFFNNAHYHAYRDAVAARGIDVPIVPGVFPIHSYERVSSFAARCGATIPRAVAARFADIEPGSEREFRTAVECAVEQINDLARAGAPHIHLYTLNQSPLALAVYRELNEAP